MAVFPGGGGGGGGGGSSSEGVDPAYARWANGRIHLLQSNVPDLDPGSIYGLATSDMEDDEMLAGALGSVSMAEWAQQAATLKNASPERQRAAWSQMSEDNRRMISQFGYAGPTGHDAIAADETLRAQAISDPSLRNLDASKILGSQPAVAGIPIPQNAGDVAELVPGALGLAGSGLQLASETAMSQGGNILGWMHTAGDTFAGRPFRTMADMQGEEQYARFQLMLTEARQNLEANGLALTESQWTGMMNRLYEENDVSFKAFDRFRPTEFGADPFGDQSDYETVSDGTYNAFVAEAERLRSEEEYEISGGAAFQRTATGEHYIKPSVQLAAQGVLGGDGTAFDLALHLSKGKSIEDFVEKVEGIPQGDAAFDGRMASLQTLASQEVMNEAINMMSDGKSSLGREFARTMSLDPEDGLGMWVSGATDLTAVLSLDPILFGGKVGKGARVYTRAIDGAEGVQRTHQLALAHRALKNGDKALALQHVRQSVGRWSAGLTDEVVESGTFAHRGARDDGFASLMRRAFEKENVEFSEFVQRAPTRTHVRAKGVRKFGEIETVDRAAEHAVVGTRLVLENPDDARRVIDAAEAELQALSTRYATLGQQPASLTRMETKLDDLRSIVDDVELLDVDKLTPAMKMEMRAADRAMKAADRAALAFKEARLSGNSAMAKVALHQDMPGWTRALDVLGNWDRYLTKARGVGIETGDDIFEFYRTAEGLGALTGRKFGNYSIADRLELPRLSGGRVVVKWGGNKVTDTINFLADGKAVIPVKGARPVTRRMTQPIGRFYKALTTHMPLERSIPLFGDDLGQNAIVEFSNLVKMGSFGGIDEAKQARYLEDFINGVAVDAAGNLNLQSRLEVYRAFMDDLFQSAGVNGNEKAQAWAKEFLERTEHRYAPRDLDVIPTSNGPLRVPLLPYAQWSDKAAIPDFAGFLANTRRTTFTRFAWMGANNRMADAFMGTYWKPAMLLKLGFIPRAAGEEMLGFFAKVGSRDFAEAYAAKFATNLTNESKLVNAVDVVTGLKPLRMPGLRSWFNVEGLRALPDEAFRYGELMAHQDYAAWRAAMIDRHLGGNAGALKVTDRFAGHADYFAARTARAIQRAAFRSTSPEMQQAVLLMSAAKGHDYANLADLYKGENLQQDLQRAATYLFMQPYMQRVHADVAASGMWVTALENPRDEPFATLTAGKKHMWDREDPGNVVQISVHGSKYVDMELGDGMEAMTALFFQLRKYADDPVVIAWLDEMAATVHLDQLDAIQPVLTGRYAPPAAPYARVSDRTLPEARRFDWLEGKVTVNPRLVAEDFNSGTFSLMDDDVWLSLNIDPAKIKASFPDSAAYHAFLENTWKSQLTNKLDVTGRARPDQVRQLQVAYTDAWGGIPDHALYGVAGTQARTRLAHGGNLAADTRAETMAAIRKMEKDLAWFRKQGYDRKKWVDSVQDALHGASDRPSRFPLVDSNGNITPIASVTDAQVDAFITDPLLRRRWNEVKGSRRVPGEYTAADDVFRFPTFLHLVGGKNSDQANAMVDMLRNFDSVGKRTTSAVLSDVPVRLIDESGKSGLEAIRAALNHPDMQPFVRDHYRRLVDSLGNRAVTNPQIGERTYYGVLLDPRTADEINAAVNASVRGRSDLLQALRANGLEDRDVKVMEKILERWHTRTHQAYGAAKHYDDLDLRPLTDVVITDDQVVDRIGQAIVNWQASTGRAGSIAKPGYLRRLDETAIPRSLSSATFDDIADGPIPMYAASPDAMNNLEPVASGTSVVRFNDQGLPDPAGTHLRNGLPEEAILDDWAEKINELLTDTFMVNGELVHELAEPIRRGQFDFAALENVGRDNLPQHFVGPMMHVDNESLLQKGLRFGFDRVIGSAIASLVRKPMFLLEVRNGLRMSEPMAALMRNPYLADQAAQIGLHGDQLDHAREAWSMLPDNMRNYVGTDMKDLTLSARTRPERVRHRSNEAQRWMGNHLDDHPMNAWLAALPEDQFEIAYRMLSHDEKVNRKVLDAVLDGAHRNMFRYIDDHRIKSYFQGYARNIMPFMFAQEQFLKRWARIMVHSPEAMRRAQLVGHGVLNSGFVHEDEYGNPVFIIPGAEHLQQLVQNVPVMNTLWGESGTIPISAPFTGQINHALPGVGPGAFDMPGVSPILSIPLHKAVEHFPELRALEEGLIGPTANTGTWANDFLPAWLIRGWTGAFGTESSREINASMISAVQMMEAEGIRLQAEADEALAAGNNDKAQELLDRRAKLVLPEEATEMELEEYLDRVKHWARSALVTRGLMGFFSPAPVAIEYDDAGLNREFVELLEYMDYDEALGVFLAEHPDGSPYTVVATEKSTKAPLPATDEALAWMDENRAALEEFPLAAPWLMPQDRNGSEFSRAAYNDQFAFKLRTRKTPTQWYRDFKFMASAETYFDAKLKYQQALAATDDPAMRAEIERDYQARATQFKNQHPLFRTMLEQQNRTDRVNALDELRLVLDDPLGPPSPHKNQLRTLIQGYDRFTAQMAVYKNDQTTSGRQIRQGLKTSFATWGAKYITDHPEAATFWKAMIEPLADVRDDAQVATVLSEDPTRQTADSMMGG